MWARERDQLAGCEGKYRIKGAAGRTLLGGEGLPWCNPVPVDRGYLSS